jgi:cysteinyl-tRNA synthetase
MLRTHYRQPIDWTRKGLEESRATLMRWGDIYTNCGGAMGEGWVPSVDVVDALKDDLNTPLAISRLHELARQAKGGSSTFANQWAASAALLGLDAEKWHRSSLSSTAIEATDPDLALRISKLVEARSAARKAKDYKEGDRIRDELAGMGVSLKDAKDPETGEVTTTWEVAR